MIPQSACLYVEIKCFCKRHVYSYSFHFVYKFMCRIYKIYMKYIYVGIYIISLMC